MRVADTDHHGAINAKHGMDLHRGAFQLWEAGVASLLDKTSAKEYWNRAHLPLPEHGSYVITMLSPIVSPEVQIGFDNMIDTRRVSIKLEEAFKELRVRSTKILKGDDTAFDDAADKGITSDLCRRLAQTVKPFERLDIGFSLAATVLQRRKRYRLQFSQQDYSVLQEASKQLKGANKVEPTEQQIVSGYVTACKRPPDKKDGTITLKVLRPDGKMHTINLDVKEAEYRLAVDAHKNKSRVEAQGILVGTGRNLHWKLNDPKLQVVE